ncbi:MAG: hypothetical protein JETT_3131 [Candidatus Jettenia ecosi]|uniref:Uncharacterized protein n=1 Tax=Candidatus Jettenia ecosi TaxID=2494326 RepID=A0A533Q7M6_9BACT|nr:MAG: hypothetical protein JETT_3131 [Candidatus Jettenia ecosi]
MEAGIYILTLLPRIPILEIKELNPYYIISSALLTKKTKFFWKLELRRIK